MSGSARLYRLPLLYRSHRLYDGSDTALPVGQAGEKSTYRARWARKTPRHASVALGLRQPDPHVQQFSAPWGADAAHERSFTLPLRDLDAHGTSAALPWATDAPHARSTAVPMQQLDARDAAAALPWGDFQGHHASSDALPFRSPTPRATSTAVPWGTMAAHALASSAFWKAAIARGAMVALPWSPIAARSASVRLPYPVEPNVDPSTIVIPSLPVYLMIPTLAAVRLPDLTPIRLLSISIEFDRDSWAWTFTAPVKWDDVALFNLTGTPTEMQVTVNGHVWAFMVEGWDDNRRFGSKTATLRGKSRSGLLGAPYAAVRTYTQTAARDASQLAAEELDGSGWTLVWDAVDWLVPGGTFGYQDLAPIDAIAQLAASIGARLASDPAAKTLTVTPGYETSPWAWDAAVPYAILPASILTAGGSNWDGGGNANGVYVFAENAAVGALVKLTGSAGDQELPQVVDRLLVHSDAIGERGRIELARDGKRRTVTRSIPLFPSPPPAGFDDLGVVPIGKLLEVEDGDETWRGQVIGIRIDASRNGSAISVRQQLTIERQYR